VGRKFGSSTSGHPQRKLSEVHYARCVAALEDKIVQRATAAVLNAIYEEDFLGLSYGFRPKRSQHDALDALVVGITSKKVNFILDADIQGFFDAVGQSWLIRFVEHRIADPRIIRLIQKWLKAGILEEGVVTVSDTGTGQGSVITPLTQKITFPDSGRAAAGGGGRPASTRYAVCDRN
jgi:RNA-directed DNA polymerase